MDFSINSKFYHFMSKVADCMILSVLWLFTSLPLVTIGTASTALYYCIIKVIREESGSPVKSFFHAFRNNFKQGVAISLIAIILCILTTLVGSAVYAFATNGDTLAGIYFAYLVLLAFGIAWLHYAISYVARFQASLGTILKNSLVLCIFHLPLSLSMMLLLVIVAVAWFMMLPASFMALLLLPAGYAWISSFLLERIYSKYLPAEEECENEA